MAETSPPRTASTSTTSSSTMTDVADAEAQGTAPWGKLSFFRTMTDHAGITQQVLDHKYVGEGTTESPYQVNFLSNDPYDATTYAEWKKWSIIGVQAMGTLSVAFASSAYSGGVGDLMRDFQITSQTAILGVSMFVLGFAIGPLFWGPLSEIYGRQKLFFITHLGITAFSAGAAAAPNIASLIVLRFLAGAFGSSPMTNAGAVIADMFDAKQRGIAGSLFAMAPFLGPAIGPVAGGFLGEAEGWRWVQGMSCIFSGVMWLLTTFTYPETYAPVLLNKRAAALSKRTGKVYISYMEMGKPPKTIGQQFAVGLSRPWILLFKEPIVLLTSIYMAIIYGTLYLCFAAFPIVFQVGRGWGPGTGGLAFLGLAVGMVFAVSGNIFDNKRYVRISNEHGGMAPPEARLPPAIVGSFLIPVGMFMFAWTNGPEIHWIVPIIGSAIFGGGIVLVFMSLLTYLIETYVIFAASVLAANSVLRSLFGMAFPLFTTYMYEDLGIHWASSIPAFLAIACLPFPILFYKYGNTIRMKCFYASEAAAVVEKMRAQHAAVITEDEAMEEVTRKITAASRASRA